MQLKQVVVSGLLFLMFDSIYLYTISDFFNKVIKEVQGEKIQMNLIGAIFSYIFLIFGLNYFILDQRKSLKEAFLYGFVMYGVYETTNYALLKKWSPLAVLLDTFWGGCLYLLSTYFTRRIL